MSRLMAAPGVDEVSFTAILGGGTGIGCWPLTLSDSFRAGNSLASNCSNSFVTALRGRRADHLQEESESLSNSPLTQRAEREPETVSDSRFDHSNERHFQS